MQIVAVLVAAVAAFGFGAIWYTTLGKTWLRATGLELGPDGLPVVKGSAAPLAISFVCLILVAGMMRHVMVMSGLAGAGYGLMVGFGLGAFVVLPWIVTNYAYAMRARNLTLIDGTYAVVGCTIIGVVLGLFL